MKYIIKYLISLIHITSLTFKFTLVKIFILITTQFTNKSSCKLRLVKYLLIIIFFNKIDLINKIIKFSILRLRILLRHKSSLKPPISWIRNFVEIEDIWKLENGKIVYWFQTLKNFQSRTSTIFTHGLNKNILLLKI